MIQIKTIKERDEISVDLYIEGLAITCTFEMKAIFNALEHESPEIFHAALEIFLAERGFGDESED